MGVLEQLGGLRRHMSQNAALYRLHHHHLLAVLDGDFIAPAGLDILAVPVQIVDLQLDEVHLRVRGKNLVQQRGGVVERKTDVLG